MSLPNAVHPRETQASEELCFDSYQELRDTNKCGDLLGEAGWTRGRCGSSCKLQDGPPHLLTCFLCDVPQSTCRTMYNLALLIAGLPFVDYIQSQLLYTA